jgi:hypothetical protein
MRHYEIKIKETIISTYSVILDDHTDPVHAFYEMAPEEQESLLVSGDSLEWAFYNVEEIPYIEEGI